MSPGEGNEEDDRQTITGRPWKSINLRFANSAIGKGYFAQLVPPGPTWGRGEGLI